MHLQPPHDHHTAPSASLPRCGAPPRSRAHLHVTCGHAPPFHTHESAPNCLPSGARSPPPIVAPSRPSLDRCAIAALFVMAHLLAALVVALAATPIMWRTSSFTAKCVFFGFVIDAIIDTDKLVRVMALYSAAGTLATASILSRLMACALSFIIRFMAWLSMKAYAPRTALELVYHRVRIICIALAAIAVRRLHILTLIDRVHGHRCHPRSTVAISATVQRHIRRRRHYRNRSCVGLFPHFSKFDSKSKGVHSTT